MEKYAVIVAGGEGTRLGGGLPKQFRMLGRRPVLWWALNAFHTEDPSTNIRVVLHPDYFEEWKKLFQKLPEKERISHEIIPGGKTRTESVRNGIASIPASENALIAVHDAARPLVSVEMIGKGWRAAAENGGAVPVTPVTDSLRQLDAIGSRAVDRNAFVAVQTPQVFRADLLKEAYSICDGVFSDDASVYEASGHHPALYAGSPLNIKVTNPGDLEIAELLLRRENPL